MSEAHVEPYMYVPAIAPERLLGSAKLVATGTAQRIIDLEDSVQDPNDIARTAQLKEQARSVLLDHFSRSSGQDDQPFYVRVNSLESGFFEGDVKAVQELGQRVDLPSRLSGIVLPKTVSRSEIESTASILGTSVPGLAVMPLVESRRGMENLTDIIAADSVQLVGFGPHDYFYDLGIFPIPRSALTSQICRETLNHMITEIKVSNQMHGKDVGFKDSCHTELHSESSIQDAARYLYQISRGIRLGKTALNPMQAQAMASIGDWDRRPNLTSEDDVYPEDVKAIAQRILQGHEARRNKDLGVGRQSDGRYISLQDVLGAQRILNL